ncbi:tRNA (adenosine(37)-N6)-dimethylallyltransferase MiaA [Paroceanicella profunda]|uniref:tRNA dimethylallyltransferase n=1 Tax=Paroceanicella profunda TaxID=2579971 RepID=A0A5B8FWF9_9RHOB|nr:tRNA (adenosine(37)-N6)-dimethylallyltransferase MiaA [Paroceanicella profunda]QDL91844.1 tRNA (adenosine(37)-N6)-dimethylallyltransferase MiaA [Paroceanicella profunda]
MTAILIAGPTASGKSALALALAAETGGTIVNADALQVYADWRVLTARPSAQDEAQAPHRLYGGVGFREAWSAGHWLRAVTALMAEVETPIFVGGTGLYFLALTEGLAEIPETPPEIRARGDALRREAGRDGLAAILAERDPATLARLDRLNPMRLQRAWEVLETTGRPLSAWQDETPPPLIPPGTGLRLQMAPDTDWLNARIDRRFDAMLAEGALEEARALLPVWDPARPAAYALGARELIAHLRGEMPLEEAAALARTGTRQYAKRQRSWFRSRMRDWRQIDPRALPPLTELLGS